MGTDGRSIGQMDFRRKLVRLESERVEKLQLLFSDNGGDDEILKISS